MFFQENLWLQFINFLLSLNLIMVIWSMINQIMKVSASRLKVFLAITGAIKGTSRLKLYNEISSESLKFRRWFRKLCTFYDININSLPSYLFDLIPKSSHMYNTPSLEDVATLYSRTGIFKYLFFLSTISEWNKLDLKIRQSKTLLNLRNSLIKI